MCYFIDKLIKTIKRFIIIKNNIGLYSYSLIQLDSNQ